ncbi:type II toxin-antitoxin system VapC family toxin [Acidianus sp. HS-5]|uniref:type II toxin-antitoxin system VapC family toxin n=1 Tax=Acidianus sp. HS-5 TaxID=2886040 RepID=UPI001F18B928|nr:type II toxin-antitoxin system VapC family toxin [Acidianus sp. HS-5]
MRGKFLLDASSIYPLLNYVDSIDVSEVYILPLTFYEVGNAVWKESYIHRRVKDPFTLSSLFQKFMEKLKVLSNPPANEVMKVAVNMGLTFYDASYVYSAKVNNLTLVSEDKDLIKKANAISFKDFIE